MYEKYQEAADALRHERWGRKHAEAVLERVLYIYLLIFSLSIGIVVYEGNIFLSFSGFTSRSELQ